MNESTDVAGSLASAESRSTLAPDRAASLPFPEPGPEERREHLDRTLHRAGCSVESLTKAVDRSFGSPRLIVATGSVTAGFGTPRSDLDLFTVVPSDGVALLPLTGYELPIRLEVRHLSESRIHETEATVRQGWPPAATDRGSRDALTRRESLLDMLVRLALGVEVEAESSEDGHRWRAWRSALEAPWLVEQVVSWRWWEAWRLRTTWRWLSPVVAAQRLTEATALVLDALAAEAGQIYMGIKWLPQKLERLGTPELLNDLRRAEEFLAADDLEAHLQARDRFLEQHLDQLADRHAFLRHPAHLMLTLGDDVEVISAYQRQFVTRWRLRAVELRPPVIPQSVSSGEEPLWEGAIDDSLPDWVAVLLREGMACTQVVRDG